MSDGQPKGYIILDRDTGAFDWDCEVHPTIPAAIESMTGYGQMYSTEEFPPADLLPWWLHYAIHPVGGQLEIAVARASTPQTGATS